MNRHVLVVGDLCPDIIVSGVPTAGSSLRFGQAEDLVTASSMTLGSSAGITACAVAAAGVQVALLAVIGDDLLGRSCVEWLRQRNVDTRHVAVEPNVPTGSSVILVKHSDPSDRQILTHLGSMAVLTPDHLQTLLSSEDGSLEQVTHLHISSFFLHLAARDKLHLSMADARTRGITISLDTNDDPARDWASGAQEAIAQSDVLFCNDNEAVGLAGRSAGTPPQMAVRELLSTMPTGQRDSRFPAVVHKQGHGGATVHTPQRTVQVRAAAVEVVDTVGAGDTLAGTALALLSAGLDWPEVLRVAVAAATLSTRAHGGVDGQPNLAEAQQHAASLKLTIGPPRAEGTP